MIAITITELDVKVGNSIYSAQLDFDGRYYKLPPEAIQALAAAYNKNLQVKVRFANSGTVNEIGPDTVKAFASLFRTSASFKPLPSVHEEQETPPVQEPTTDPRIERCLKYGC